MRLTVMQAGFLDATPIQRGKLVDFFADRKKPSEAIQVAEEFWQKHKNETRRIQRVQGIIHSLYLGQARSLLEFERLLYLYTALDACYAHYENIMTVTRRPSHAKRIQWMCTTVGIEVPKWADPGSAKNSEVSLARNNAIHEALFFDKPLGFASFGASASGSLNVILEMQALTSRLLVALLGRPNCKYVKSPVNTRMQHALDL